MPAALEPLAHDFRSGADVSAMVLGLGPRVGVFQRVGTGDGSSTIVAFDIGFGL